MKYRQGFVSNSSTTSFMLYGTVFEFPEDIRKYFDFIEFKGNLIWALNKTLSSNYISEGTKKDIKEELSIVENAFEWDDLEDYLDNRDNYDVLDTIFGDSDFQTYQVPYDNYVYVGVSPKTMRDEQTLGEWKGQIAEKFKDAGMRDDVTFNWIEGAWRDG